MHSVGFMCILRIIYTERGSVDTSGRWVYAQINVGIVCACLPTLKPVIPKGGAVTTTVRILLSSIRSSLGSTGSGKGQAADGKSNDASVINRHDRYHNISRDTVDKAHLTQAIGGSEPFEPSQDYPMDKIKSNLFLVEKISTSRTMPSSTTARLIDGLPTPSPRPKEMQVLALGMSRTGTYSMFIALGILGYKPYHMAELKDTAPGTHALWVEALKAKYHDRTHGPPPTTPCTNPTPAPNSISCSEAIAP
ncbi:MAG: hypothetical protein Q9197_001626 [Variospora fuerteventurae]